MREMNHENKLRPDHDDVTGDQNDSKKYSEDRQNVANNHNDVSGVYNDVVGSHEYVEENQKDQNTAKDRGMLTGMFRDRQSTESAYNTLQEKGYSKDDINLVMSDETRKKHFSGDVEDTEIGTKAAEGAGKGSAIGGTVGAVVGVIAAIGTSLVIPGLGIVIAGPIAAGLVGAGAGGITGGVIGALVGSGIPEARAKLYESGIKEGNIVMGVRPRNEEDSKFFETNWRTNKAEEIHY